jgi:uncharacterized protein (DUF433 family)
MTPTITAMVDHQGKVKGTRIRALDIGLEFEYLGKSPDEIVRAHPHLSLAQVHSALAYFYEHIQEMREKIKSDEAFVEKLKLHYPSKATVTA